MEDFNGVFFNDVCFGEVLVVVEVDKVGRSIVLAPLSAFRAVPSEMSYFSALKTCIRRVSCGSRVALEVVLRVVPLIPIGVLSSSEVIPSVIPSVIPLGWCSVPIYIHRNWGVIHPSRGVR